MFGAMASFLSSIVRYGSAYYCLYTYGFEITQVGLWLETTVTSPVALILSAAYIIILTV